MGVTGLWRLIEPAGKPVPIETLENKVLAVDISIWLHQVVKGYQDAKGAPLPNAHLMGLFQRLCKLLYFRIKPVFVFDGGFPALKRETIAKRQDHKNKYNSESERLKREITLLLGKKTALGSLLGTQISPKKNKNIQDQADDDIFKLPALPQKEESESDSEDEESSSASTVDLHSVDVESDDFKNMPLREKYDLLVELKDTRKMNSWGKLHTLPKKSDNFSDFQMQRLLKRRKVQECLQETEKEMGDIGMSMNELESFLNEEGIDTKLENLPTRRIASDNTTRFLLINNVQQALADAKKREAGESSKCIGEMVKDDTQDNLVEDSQTEIKLSLECKDVHNNINIEIKGKDNNELDEDLEEAIKMSLECHEDPNTSVSKTDDSWTSYKSDTDNNEIVSDSEDEDGYEQPDFSTAKAYIMQYSDFTHNAIDHIVSSKANSDSRNKKKSRKVHDIIEEINKESSEILCSKVDVSSDDEETVHHRHHNDKFVTSLNTSSSVGMLENESQVEQNEKIKCKKTDESHQKDVSTVVNIDMTQSSVVFVENVLNDVISLDTSSEEILKSGSSKPIPKDDIHSENQSDSNDDEFEEVAELIEPSVEVSLNIPEKLENDIFADVFNEQIPNTENRSEILIGKKQLTTFADTNIAKETEIKIAKETEMAEVDIKLDSKRIDDSNKIITKEETKLDSNSVYSGTQHIDTNSQETKSLEDSDKNIARDEKESKIKVSDKRVEKLITTEAITSMVAEIESEEQNLQQQKGRLDRIGRNITEQMTKEAQELLQIFGIPYIIAPMEAEAQCAFLESVNLTDGTITDDSDIWLFGGKTVYKNFFNQKKHVLQFLSEKIEKSFNLSREQLILLALLVGSDYTTGVSGIGPVTALEILASFPFNKRQLLQENSKQELYQLIVTGLQEFKTWVRAGRRTDNISLKKKLRNIKLGEDFPSIRVVQAYLEPNVEQSKEKFTWGQLDITILRDYAKAKFGWSQNKLDVIIQPVLKRMLEKKTQKTVQDYFKRKIHFQSLEDQMSKRVKAAVQKLDRDQENVEKDSEVLQEEIGESEKTGKKRKAKTKKQNLAGTSATQTETKKKKVVKSVEACTTTEGGIEINVPKTDRYQEIIPQREKDMQNILQNKLKAIEVYRKTKIDRKRKPVKRKIIQPKDKADLSESSDSN